MATAESPKQRVARPQSRKSIAHMPSPEIVVNKENATVNSTELSNLTAQKKTMNRKRSKSIGPGGLDALKEGSGNQQALPSVIQVKSILKPAIRLSPPKQIPPHSSARMISVGKTRIRETPEKSKQGLLIDTSDELSTVPLSGAELPNPFGGPSPSSANRRTTGSPSRGQTKVAVRTEEEQQAAAKERERLEMLAHGNTRRKSLANRRVSFAPEATLHTWDIVELPEDSTTSSASGVSTRRASVLSAMATSPYPQPHSHLPNSDGSEPPSTPPERIEEVQIVASPAHQRDLHQKKRRRSSGIPPMNFNNPGDFSSSPYGGSSGNSDTNSSPSLVAGDMEVNSSDSDDKDLVGDESTITAAGNDNGTAHSSLSAHSSGSFSTGSSGRLEEALRQAARQAGTQGILYDEHGDMAMEMADDDITSAFRPWMEEVMDTPPNSLNPATVHSQDKVNSISPSSGKPVSQQLRLGEPDATMDITQALGTILPKNMSTQGSPTRSRRKSGVGGERGDSRVRRCSSGASSLLEEETMELTTAIGGIQESRKAGKLRSSSKTQEAEDEDEDLSMDLTTVIGGVLEKGKDDVANHQLQQDQDRRESGESTIDGDDMDITFAVGGILPPITERTEPPEDQTMDIDITQALGAILPSQLNNGNNTDAKVLMEKEADAGQLPTTLFESVSPTKDIVRTPTGHGKTKRQATVTPDIGNQGLAGVKDRSSARRTSTGPSHTMTPQGTLRQSTPMKKITTPSKQLTPVAVKPRTPEKTPPSKNVTLRTGSPKKLFKKEIKNAATSPKARPRNHTCHPQPSCGAAKPNIVLGNTRRRSSGLGVDKVGLGSPRVTELLARRASISENAQSFDPCRQVAQVHFDDPRVMEEELEHERVENKKRESGRGILQQEANAHDINEDKDATANLKDMIESLTPQKKKIKGRKSLHVGAAKGILGKRPAELDMDEDADASPNLKGREGSPVKKVKLPAPPSKVETTGHITRSSRVNLAETTANARMSTPLLGTSPQKQSVTTPQEQPRFKNTSARSSPENPVTSFEDKVANTNLTTLEPSEKEDRIHLQDFLNMTNIRFMELTTTKRRLTVAPTNAENNTTRMSLAEGDIDIDPGAELENCVVAGACTVPMLELYQHSCRELKKYIAEGRSIVRDIETDTYEENPPLFREYMTVAPDIKLIMDNQFKNVKTHARLLSKAMWYEWRMKLLDGLKDGLVHISKGMDEDEDILIQQERLLGRTLPTLIAENDLLQVEHQTLQAQADELANCDQDELRKGRANLSSMMEDLEAKRKLVEELRTELQAKETGIRRAAGRMEECLAEIKDSERVQQESRRWKIADVLELQANVTELQDNFGWTITAAAESTITMTYKGALQLYFAPDSFIVSGKSSVAVNPENSSIGLAYVANNQEHHPQPLTTEKRFFLQIMRVQLQCLQQSQTTTQDLLAFVSRSWETACAISEEIRILGVSYITEPTIISDELMMIQSTLLIQSMRTKVETYFKVQAQAGEGIADLEIAVKSSVTVVYGERPNEKKMADFVDQKLSESDESGSWLNAVKKMEERLIARGKK
ncbi:MAG: hypothetical protein Q9167_001229 [Letrouitia subvulpina]